MKFYNVLEKILEEKDKELKFSMFYDFYKVYKDNDIVFEKNYIPKYFEEPSYTDICNIVSPKNVPKRSNLTSKEGQINFLHAIAHIEYSAIDLALDASYRFINMPKKYYDDWLEVADDEIRHFLMLEALLKKLDAEYGDIEVHNSLFEASQRTQNILERMAVVPRYLEANGLDATPVIVKKLKNLPKSNFLDEIIDSLEIILDEEIYHVKKGDFWFKYICKKDNIDKNIYFDIVKKYYPRNFIKNNNLNVEARQEAGFSCYELNIIANKNVC